MTNKYHLLLRGNRLISRLAGYFNGYWHHLIFCRRSLIVGLSLRGNSRSICQRLTGSREGSIRWMSAQRISWILQQTVLGVRLGAGINIPV